MKAITTIDAKQGDIRHFLWTYLDLPDEQRFLCGPDKNGGMRLVTAGEVYRWVAEQHASGNSN